VSSVVWFREGFLTEDKLLTGRLIDMGADMSESERKKFAANAINDLMKTV